MSNATTTSPDHTDPKHPVAETLTVNAPIAKTEVSVVSPEIAGLEEKISTQVHKVVDATVQSLRAEAQDAKKDVQQLSIDLRTVKDEIGKSDEKVAEFASSTSKGISELQKTMVGMATELRSVQEKSKGAEKVIQTEKVAEKKTEPSLWQRTKARMSRFWHGTKRGGEKVGEGVGAVGNAAGNGIRAVGHEIGEAVRGVDDALRDTTKLVVGKGAGNVMKYGSYVALGAPAWMPKVWNFLTGKDANGKKMDKIPFGRKLAIAAGWTTAGLSLLANPWNLVWMGIPTVAWGLHEIGKKFVQEANKPEGFKVTARVLGGVGAVGAYSAAGGALNATFALGTLGVGVLGRLYRWARGKRDTYQKKEKGSSSQVESVESNVAAPQQMDELLQEMEASRKAQKNDHAHEEKDDHPKDGLAGDHSHVKKEAKSTVVEKEDGKVVTVKSEESHEVADASPGKEPKSEGHEKH